MVWRDGHSNRPPKYLLSSNHKNIGLFFLIERHLPEPLSFVVHLPQPTTVKLPTTQTPSIQQKIN